MTTDPTLKQALVPLGVAASYAYAQLTPEQDRVTSSDDLAKVLRGVAIALSALAPIFRQDDRTGAAVALTTSEIVTVLFLQAEQQGWERLAMRQGDLKAAIMTLRQVRTAFGPPQ